MKDVLLVGTLAALCIFAQGVQLPEEGRRLMSAFGGRGAVPKATSLLQSQDEFVDADETSDADTSQVTEGSSAAVQDKSTEGAKVQETEKSEETEEAEEAEASATASAAQAEVKSQAAAEATSEEKSVSEEEASHASAAEESEVSGAKGKKKRRAGLFSLMKAQVDIMTMRKELEKMQAELETAQNKTGRCHWKKEMYANKSWELRAEKEFRKKSKGKHLVMNETLAKARRAAGNHSTIGLWIITDDPFTREDEDREKFQRSMRRLKKNFENITKLEEAVKKYTDLEDVYTARTAYYTERVAEVNSTLQAAMNLRAEAKHNLRPKRRRQAEEEPVV